MPQSSSQFSSGFSSNFTSTPSLHVSKMSVTAPLTSIPSFDKQGLDQASRNWLHQAINVIDSSLRLPDNPRAFGIFLLGLLIVFIGGFLQVLISAQIMQAEITLARFQEEYRVVEQQNGDLIFQIARDSNMARLYDRVVANGYVPVDEREYIFKSNNFELDEAVASASQGTNAEAGAAAGVVASIAAEQAVVSETTLAETTMPAAAQVNLTSGWGGQVARWEEFWSNAWRAATGGVRASTLSQTQSVQPAQSNPASQNNPNFWAVWWEQASDQGTKLLEQIRGQ